MNDTALLGLMVDECSAYSFVWLDAFSIQYQSIHTHLSLIICVLGVIVNTINVVVLSQREMRSSTSVLLSALAVGDAAFMAIYIFYVAAYRINSRLETGMTKSYAYALLVCLFAQNLFHTFTAWMIVILALFRFMYMRAGLKAKLVCNHRRVVKCILCDVLISLLFTSPFLFAHKVVHLPDGEVDCGSGAEANSHPCYVVDYAEGKLLRALLFLSSAVFIKALPIALMSGFSAALIHLLHCAQRRSRATICLNKRHILAGSTNAESGARSAMQLRSGASEASSRQKQQTTNILLAMIFLYVLTYLPQSIMLLLNHYMGVCFAEKIYEKLGDFIDLLTLINSGANFVLYCGISSQFRTIFLDLMRRHLNSVICQAH